jgi:chemotaxis methyl-accepting protein methylase
LTKYIINGIIGFNMKEIGLEFPTAPIVHDRPMSSRTALFREGSYLPLSSRMADERAGGEGLGSFVSVGCSNGAEVDGTLALQNSRGRDRGVTATGIDINPQAVRAAQEGSYTLRRLFFALGPKSPQELLLAEMGFGVERVPVDPIADPLEAAAAFQLRADAAPVREGHKVRFLEHDAVEPLPVDGPIDLGMINNMLYHLRGETSARIVRSVASALSDRGILNFGGSTLNPDSNRMDPEPIITLLDEEFDMGPLFTDSHGTPVIFGRA